MEENELEMKIKDFSNYLIEIGLLNNFYIKDFYKKFKEINENGIISSSGNEETDKNIELIYFKDSISKTIVEFYNSVPEERKIILALNIFSKYNERKKSEDKKNENNKKAENDQMSLYEIEKIPPINIIATKKIDKQYTNQKKNNNNSHNNDKNLKLNTNKENSKVNIPKSIRNNSFNSHKPKKYKLENLKNKNKKKHNITINENCTFQPNTRNIGDNITNANLNNNTITKNLSFNKNNNNESVFERLNKISERKKKEIENIKKELNKENIFQPNKDKKSIKNLKRENFDERLKNFEKDKKDKEQKRKENEQKQFLEKFPFNPKPYNRFKTSYKKLKNNKNNTQINIHEKLYEENKKIKEKNENRMKQVMDQILEMANHPISVHNNTNYFYKNIKIETKKKFTGNKSADKIISNKISTINRVSNNNKKKRKIKLEYRQYKMEENKINYNDNEFKKIEELYNEYKKMKDVINFKQNENKDININLKYNFEEEKLNDKNEQIEIKDNYNTYENTKSNICIEYKDYSKECDQNEINHTEKVT